MNQAKKNNDLSCLHEAIRSISREVNPERIILFGSRAREDHKPDSDFDLFIVKDIPKEEVRTTRLLIRKLLLDIQLKNKISFDIHVYSPDRIEYRKNVICDQFYQEIFKNGKEIYAKQNLSNRMAGNGI